MDCDIAIVGGGLAGTSLACALREMRVAIVDASRPALPAAGEFDSRVYAISPGNAAFLDAIGAWERIPAAALTPVLGMQVWGDDGRSEIGFDAWDSGVQALAWIVEDRVLQQALRDALAGREGVDWFAPAQCEALAIEPGRAQLALQGGRRIRAQLVVGADGASSFVRESAGIAAREKPYGQAAVVANFACTTPHAGIARQWFQGGPVLAMLPLPGAHVSMVWSTAEAEAARLAALAPQALCEEAARACHGALGDLSLVTPARTFALRRLDAMRTVGARVALVGDAAHVLHPLAGQGANLGFGDVRVLAQVLAAREPGRDPGDRALLRRYERARAEPILAMRATVDGLFRLFDSGNRAAGSVRNAGLKLVDRLAVVKNLLMRQAMQ